MFIYWLAFAVILQSYFLSYVHVSDIASQFTYVSVAVLIVMGGYFTLHARKVIGLFCLCAILPLLVHYFLLLDKAKFPFQKLDVDLIVEVVSDSVSKPWGSKTHVRVTETVNCTHGDICNSLMEKRIELSDYRFGNYLAGQQLRAKVRLKPILGFVNPGGFDYEYWQYTKRVFAKGYFKKKPEFLSLDISDSWNHRVRRLLLESDSRSDNDFMRGRGLLSALILGDRSRVDYEDKHTLAELGLIHLFVISGLHIGLLYFSFLWLIRIVTLLLNTVCSKSLRIKVLLRYVDSLLSYIAASKRFKPSPSGFIRFGIIPLGLMRVRSIDLRAISMTSMLPLLFIWWYVNEIGYPIPAVRAAVFLSMWQVARLLSTQLSSFQVLALSIWIILSVFPEQLFSLGFWMSILAVTSLILASWGGFDGLKAEHTFARSLIVKRLKWAFKAQIYVTFALMPFSLLLISDVNPFSVLWNMLLIPMFSFIVVPLLLVVTLLLELFSDWPLEALDVLASSLIFIVDGIAFLDVTLNQLLNIFTYDDALESLAINHSFPLVLVLGLVLFLLLPVNQSFKFVGIMALLLLLSVAPRQKSEFEVWFLDVGQALSIVLVRNNRAVIYDVGFGNGQFNASDAVIITFLKERHIKEVDYLIVSHKDTDHSGGLEGINQSDYVPKHLIIPEELDHLIPKGIVLDGRVSRCHEGELFSWENVSISFLWPRDGEDKLTSNDSSCVALIDYFGFKFLFTGDITKSVEARLAEYHFDRLSSLEVMSVPHHGSKSSSSLEFIRLVDPQWAIASSGALNRFNHPAQEVVARYIESGQRFLNTADSGAIGFIWDSNIKPRIIHWSERDSFYWRTDREEK